MIEQTSPGRPCAVLRRHEMIIADSIRYYADNNTPLTKTGVVDLVMQYVEMLSVREQVNIKFEKGRPSLRFVGRFIKRNKPLMSLREASGGFSLDYSHSGTCGGTPFKRLSSYKPMQYPGSKSYFQHGAIRCMFWKDGWRGSTAQGGLTHHEETATENHPHETT